MRMLMIVGAVGISLFGTLDGVWTDPWIVACFILLAVLVRDSTKRGG